MPLVRYSPQAKRLLKLSFILSARLSVVARLNTFEMFETSLTFECATRKLFKAALRLAGRQYAKRVKAESHSGQHSIVSTSLQQWERAGRSAD